MTMAMRGHPYAPESTSPFLCRPYVSRHRTYPYIVASNTHTPTPPHPFVLSHMMMNDPSSSNLFSTSSVTSEATIRVRGGYLVDLRTGRLRMPRVRGGARGGGQRRRPAVPEGTAVVASPWTRPPILPSMRVAGRATATDPPPPLGVSIEPRTDPVARERVFRYVRSLCGGSVGGAHRLLEAVGAALLPANRGVGGGGGGGAPACVVLTEPRRPDDVRTFVEVLRRTLHPVVSVVSPTGAVLRVPSHARIVAFPETEVCVEDAARAVGPLGRAALRANGATVLVSVLFEPASLAGGALGTHRVVPLTGDAAAAVDPTAVDPVDGDTVGALLGTGRYRSAPDLTLRDELFRLLVEGATRAVSAPSPSPSPSPHRR